MSIADSAARVGVGVRVGFKWFDKAGGMPPLSLHEPVRPRALGITDREAITAGLLLGHSLRPIAAGIGRPVSTVSREVGVNMRHRRTKGAVRPGRVQGLDWARDWVYSPQRAQRRADANLSRPKVAKLAGNDWLRGQVQDRLELEHSPEQIAATLALRHPTEPEKRLSHETIYQSLYVQGRGALRRDLATRLRTGRAVRKPRRRPAERRGRIPAWSTSPSARTSPSSASCPVIGKGT